ncbi:tRNA glutamyl-Q(34) synthetase GluQRS [Rouxiella silvae]|uniref:Glutamyl-Q tRNA(Asp) synthetase n=1 Tax=Rouxiella silvae TaxID=1646373 RepID=A0AA41BYB0_9GAMM|nr:tRNA glutamyl-Q(34) synthetase GluQRS [Rouxiella silvae]KQN49441.1 glutamyl-Q tRNA(Asp) ligase [Serratia sp. Leaf50]MBF6638986.1 tRNA glutamyl-Q(34) synthetase GluQRS [Rouxiella silvae]ORJ21295.1 tRNA glutamyl-Q(34) synthetase GluQRS [Rouxiella silvae]
MSTSPYIGRFAPSPSGDLHFGSLIAALGSYLHAHSLGGKWLVRIDDLDPPREVAGSADRILASLEQYGLEWDGEVVWQSRRHEAYRETLDWLHRQGKSYYCTCTRQRISLLGGTYDGHCRCAGHGPENAAIRLHQTLPVARFHDELQGEFIADIGLAEEDFIVRRRDGLFAYNLAVVIDDHFQGVNHIVRGADLIAPTVRQLSLYQHLGLPPPSYVHLPLACNANGDKLSKQNHAPALPTGDPRPIIVQTLIFLGQSLPESWQDLTLPLLLRWAVTHWSLEKVPRKASVSYD